MSVEILSVSLSPETIEALAQRVAQLVGGGQHTSQGGQQGYSQNQQQQGQQDPWTGGPPADDGGWPQGSTSQPPQQNNYQQNQQGYQGQQNQQQNQGPTCAHGPMRYVPAGFSQSSGKAYQAFYGCSAPRGAPDKCKSVKA